MYTVETDYPSAVASYDNEGVTAAIEWCTGHMKEGDVLTVWTSLKRNLQNCAELEELAQQHGGVAHITGRGGGTPRGTGPVLMAWPDLEGVGELARHSRGIRALCITTGNEEEIRPWVTATKPTILGDDSAWQKLSPSLDPILVEALKGLTLRINHNNTISAGFEKQQVVSVLLKLHDTGIPLDADAMQGWALANGWSGKNPGRLSGFVRDINAGKRPRAQNDIRSDYIDTLRERARSTADESQD